MDYAGSLRRNWIIVVVIFAITLIVTAILTTRQTPVYETSAQLVVAPSASTTDAADVVRTLETLERRTVVATFARIAATEESRIAVAQALKVPVARVRSFRTHGSVVPNTNIIRIDTRGPDPAMAASIANATAEHTAREAAALYRVYALQFLARATPPRAPVFPDRKRNYLVGAAIGLALGAAIALARERLR